MTVSAILIAAIFFISMVLTMVGLGGGLIFSPLFVILGFAKSEAASASLASFVAPYLGSAENADALEDYGVDFTDYDWSLNDLATRPE